MFAAAKVSTQMAGMAGAEFQQDILFAFGGGDPTITIAVLDGPADRTHDCFCGARLTPLETAAAARCSDDGCATAQGTHIASLIFGQPCSSVEGVAPLCRGLIAPIFGDDRLPCSQGDLAEAIMLALDHGADVIHISGGSFESRRHPTPEMIEAVARCNRQDVVIVAGAGRDGCGSLLRRCGAVNLLPVGAIDPLGRLVGGGDRSLSDIGMTVPGANLVGAALEGRIASRSGANYAAALMSGIAGLLLAAQRRNRDAHDPGAAINAILRCATPRMSSRPGECPRSWVGRANVAGVAALTGLVWNPSAIFPIGAWHRAPARTALSDQTALRPRA
jgi:subtilisin family serine protease